ncbi:MAG: 16S rRNA (cytosine(1402)-N(4))-methyltransferase RsmH [Bacteroidia bacterium]|nr:16S rRNA (cytosine(1402)-N(4))-methyltransferase RsmH [Bacteroidia bacterium]MDW8235600.1 16S rRNA (cytosine(1402)-N(4))-methyltransferase RsmH [Bacteroidia bacterium]
MQYSSATQPLASDSPYHVPVLAETVAQALVIRPEGIYVDCTFGGGGHSRAILARLSSKGKLVGIDRDPEAPLDSIKDERFTGMHGNFAQLREHTKRLGIEQVDGIVADLGVSWHQLDTPQRGFSFRHNAPIDLRMNPQEGIPAHEWLSRQSPDELARILRHWGDLPHAYRLAQRLIREWKPHITTQEVAAIAKKIYRFKAQAYLPQLFQALRIAINQEIEALEALLQQSTEVLREGGRLALLAYHSGEVRVIKAHLHKPLQENPVTGQRKYQWRLILRRFPCAYEVKANPRSRSAQLWVLEKGG